MTVMDAFLTLTTLAILAPLAATALIEWWRLPQAYIPGPPLPQLAQLERRGPGGSTIYLDPPMTDLDELVSR